MLCKSMNGHFYVFVCGSCEIKLTAKTKRRQRVTLTKYVQKKWCVERHLWFSLLGICTCRRGGVGAQAQ